MSGKKRLSAKDADQTPCEQCGGRLVVECPEDGLVDCPVCGGLASLLDDPVYATLSVSICPMRLRSAFQVFCMRKGYKAQRAIIALMVAAIAEDATLDNARGVYSTHGTGRKKDDA